jgi:peptide/nickel transport system substrate-binding protein
MKRRAFLAAASAALAAPAVARAQATATLRFVPAADLVLLDPHWTTSYQTRDHAYMVFDALFGLDEQYRPQPQMLEGFVTENDGRTWRLFLREGLKFHDGEKVLARDCVASIQRFGKRDAFGQALMAATDELAAADDRTIVFRLKHPFPLLPQALGKSSPHMCAIMPERLARTDAFTQVTEMVGSGPFRFLAAERVAGAKAVWERNPDYVPRASGSAQWTAGPKLVHVQRVEWLIMPDAGTASAALQRGEIDWWLQPDADLLPVLRRNREITLRTIDPNGLIGTMRFNHLHPPFDNPAIRRAILHAISQADYMQALGGERETWNDGIGVFPPASPMASGAGMEAITGPRDLAKSREALKAAGYNGERVVFLAGVSVPTVKAVSEVTADLFRKLGINLDYQQMEWGTVLQRRVKMEPLDQGGWSAMHTFWSGLDHFDPVGHVFLRGNGKQAIFGWPDAPRIEELRAEWLRAPDLEAQKRIAAQIQAQAFQDVPYIPLGQRVLPTAFRSSLSGVLNGIPVFWNVRKA